jgi:polar amino acid transport system substrate-binding protein
LIVAGLGLLTAIEGSTVAAQGGAEPETRTLTVSTKPLEPFVFVDDDATAGPVDPTFLRGYSIDVWNEIAGQLGIETNWVLRDTVGEIIDDAEAGEADAAIAGISMTAEREVRIDFTHAYFNSGLQIATTGQSSQTVRGTMWDLFTSRRLLGALGFLVVMVVAISHAVWWTERKHNPEFPHDYREGIVEALWWSTVSVITGGEAVKAITGRLSRVLAVFWMVVGLFVLALVTAQATSALTLRELESDIQGLDDLGGQRVATVEGTVTETFLQDANLASLGYPTIDDALAALVDGRADAVIFDSPVLNYRATTDFAERIELVGSTFAPDPYAIALPPDSPLREEVNEALLAMARDGSLDTLHLKWFGTER